MAEEAYTYLYNDVEIVFPSGDPSVEDIYINSKVGSIAFDILNPDGAIINLLACNVPKHMVDEGYSIPDVEMEESPSSPYMTTSFNEFLVSPNWLRVKSDGAGEVKFRLRANSF